MVERAGTGFSMVGTVVHSRAHPSRWAGRTALARLTVDDAAVLIEPLPPWSVLRHPAARIPLASISRADRLPLGALRFAVPSIPELDGTRFQGLVPGDDRLTTLAQELARRGLTGATIPLATAWKEELGTRAVGSRPGLIWRDRGWPAYLESLAGFGIYVAILYVTGSFSAGQRWFLIPSLAVMAVLGVAWSVVGERLRRR